MKIRFVDLKIGDRVQLPHRGGEQLITQVVHMEKAREGRWRIQFLNDRYQYVGTEDLVVVLPEEEKQPLGKLFAEVEAEPLSQLDEPEIKRFVVGQTYMGRFASDYDTKAHFTILSRTSKTITTTVRGKQVRRGLSVYRGVEQFKPFGSYSMAMVISATDPEN